MNPLQKTEFESFQYKGSQIESPLPEIQFQRENGLLIVCTPWGPRDFANKVIKIVVDYFVSCLGDQEVTSPFSHLQNLSKTANSIRVACLLANDFISSEVNRSEYIFGTELFVGAKNGQELAFVQVGYPSIHLNRANYPLMSLSNIPDASFEFDPQPLQSDSALVRLPIDLLGLHSAPALRVGSLRLQEADSLFLSSRRYISPQIYGLKKSQRTLSEISKQIKDESSHSFWLGHWQF